MKKTLVAMAALSALTATSAFAQATIWGVVDLNYSRTSVHGSSSRTFMGQDGISSSRLGFRADEDLGGGMKAGVWLEGGLNPADGTASGFKFLRRSTVQLSGGFGEIRLGRDYTPTFWNTTIYDAFGTNGVGTAASVGMMAVQSNNASVADLIDPNNANNAAVRADNAINYFTPTMNGAKLQLMHAFGGKKSTAGGAEAESYTGARVSYDAGPLSLGLGAGTRDGAFIATTTAPYAPGRIAAKTKYQNLGASYDFGTLKALMFYGTEKVANVTVGAWNLGAVVPVRSGQVLAAYSKYDLKVAAADYSAVMGKSVIEADAKTASMDDSTKTSVGYVHNLSKNTSLYAIYAKVNNSGKGTLTVPGAPETLTSANGGAGKDSAGYSFGLKTGF